MFLFLVAELFSEKLTECFPKSGVENSSKSMWMQARWMRTYLGVWSPICFQGLSLSANILVKNVCRLQKFEQERYKRVSKKIAKFWMDL